ncbi:uncharacterized protein G2W53_016651 [Senna tora]|uniref:Uncharacterized protein n=1 Tax=Senna tora TaxID=362788 RepID=A0A834WJP1_9FABA|nr:uncharacterized protein G2W53_016651 [Senna tora]
MNTFGIVNDESRSVASSSRTQYAWRCKR